MPKKTFSAGETLLASDVNTYLMNQAVMVFDDASARSTAIPSPGEGMVTYLKDIDTVQVWDGSQWDEVSGGGSITVASTAPSGAEEGDLWFNDVSGKTFVYYTDSDGSQWVEVGQAGGPTAAVVATSAPASAEQGQLWFDSESGNLYFWYVDADGGQWVQVRSAAPIATAAAGGAVRNLLYNGAMQVAQRGTTETGITSSGYYTADRWRTSLSSLGTWTQTVESDAPTGSGFATSLKMEVTTADVAPSAADFAHMEQRLEGYDVQAIKKGSSAAESLTLSMWVKSDTTGTYVISLYDGTNTRSVSGSYTIDSADTWEFKTITFPPDTTGAFNANNAVSLRVWFWLAAGSDRTSGTLQTSWGANVNANLAVGQTNLAASTGNYWQTTGVQLETGTTASDFEHKSYGVELAECQRYYEKSYNVDVAPGTSTDAGVYQEISGSDGGGNTTDSVNFLVNKRTAPSVTFYSATGVQGDWLYFRSGATAETSASASFIGESRMRVSVNSVGANWSVVGVRGHFTADAEL